METPFIPEYNKPDAPGIAMNFDNTVALYHIVEPEDDFVKAASDVFALLKKAQETYPGWPRVFYVDIRGHEGPRYGFTEDFFEFQQDFWFATIAHFVTAFELPLTGALVNPNPQRNDLPDTLVIREPGTDGG
ncbi:MAG: hypothetical protein KatS3mg042_0767 [Rhodothermaceae bacterium]|nr:MAG: hypothetical protein KatS3mg042_0767 [Rhodothermaceae bacterium]